MLNHVFQADNQQIVELCRYRVQPLETESGSHTLELSIERASAEDSGVYVCEATNPHGRRSTDFTLIVEGWYSFGLVIPS